MNRRDFGGRSPEYAERKHVASAGDGLGASCSRTTNSSKRARPLDARTRALVIAVWLWSLVEIPWELPGSDGLAQTLALLVSKALLGLLVICTLRGVRGARLLFTIFCAVSIVAIGIDLPLEYNVLRAGFYLSLVDCAIKLAAALSLIAHYVNRDRA